MIRRHDWEIRIGRGRPPIWSSDAKEPVCVETIEDVSGASAANARLARDAPQASPRLSLIHGGREMSDTKRIRLAVALRTGQWALEDLAFDLPKGVVTGDRCREISKA